MAKVHFCLNGEPVTKQVIKYQHTRAPEDYLPVQLYYDNYKSHWYKQLDDFMDRAIFDAEFDFKLCRAVESFREDTAKEIARRKGYNTLGAFNGWFYKILANWKSNVKTSSFRLKKRPAVQCPICGRFVPRIDQAHLEHYRGISDLPKFFVYKGEIYETSAVPRVHTVTWGKKTMVKWRALQRAETKLYAEDKQRIPWPWRLSDGSKGVMCPFTKKVVPQITEVYLRSLPNKYSRYADPIRWEDFVETYPTSLIQSEVYSLDHATAESHGIEEVYLRDHISVDRRSTEMTVGVDYEQICSGNVPSEYEYAFHTIESTITSETDREILKLIAAGYTAEDIAETLEMDRRDVRRRMRSIRENKDLENLLKE